MSGFPAKFSVKHGISELLEHFAMPKLGLKGWVFPQFSESPKWNMVPPKKFNERLVNGCRQ